MIKNINLQFLISYLGLVPFLIAIADKFFFHYINKSGNFTNHKYDNYYKTTGKQAEEKDIKWMKKQ